MRKVYKAAKPYSTDDQGNLVVSANTQKDILGKWVVRSESRISGFDVIFTGAGDQMSGDMEIGGGTEFVFDFSDASQLIDAPAGYKRARIDWQFNDSIFIKEGTIYFYNMPKGSYIDMYIVCPQGYPYAYKVHGRPEEDYAKMEYANATDGEVVIQHWVLKNHLEGNCPMGDEFNTESAADTAPPTHYVWRAEITVPEVTNWEESHGHWTLELYRPSSVYFADPN